MHYYKTSGGIIAVAKPIDGEEITKEEYTALRNNINSPVWTEEMQEQEYWTNISYEDAVNAEIRKQYTVSAEFAILRQKDEKPEEYAKYYSYCEECKAYVKEKKTLS